MARSWNLQNLALLCQFRNVEVNDVVVDPLTRHASVQVGLRDVDPLSHNLRGGCMHVDHCGHAPSDGLCNPVRQK